jgi:hypothetical protein
VALSGFPMRNRLGFYDYHPFLIFIFENSNKLNNGFVSYFECNGFWANKLFGSVNQFENYASYSDQSYSLKLIDSLMMVKLQSCFVQSSSGGVLIGFPCKFYDEAKKLDLYNKAKEMLCALEAKV